MTDTAICSQQLSKKYADRRLYSSIGDRSVRMRHDA
jgi:hypothetical protein